MSEPIRYTVRFPEPEHHYAEIEARYPSVGGSTLELFLPVWTPGSYLVREYARHLEGLEATAGGDSLPVEKTRKNRWRVEAGGTSEVTVRYRLYCHDLTVRTNFVDLDFALLHGAATFLAPVGSPPRPHEVLVEPCARWGRVLSALSETAPRRFLAQDYDHLVDSPLSAGNPAVYDFEVEGRAHRLAVEGQGGTFDGARAAEDTRRIAAGLARFWGVLPYERYLILLFIGDGRGGLEHRDSTVLLANRWKLRTRKGYLDWLGLVAHEIFHAWNVKRLRPAALGPFDYEQEVYTRSLWVAEGITSYYDDLLVHRAGLSSETEYLESLAKSIQDVARTPGRLVQPLALASLDAWIKHYRPDENSPNSAMSYYIKGAVVAFLLDVTLRRLTEGRASLDDVMRRAYARYSGERGFAEEEFRVAADEVAGASLAEFFRRAVETSEELEYGEALGWLGLRLAEKKKEKKDGERAKAWLGLTTRQEESRLVVTEVRRGTPGWEAGFSAGDEILAMAGYRLNPGQWDERLAAFAPQEETEILVARRERLVPLAVRFGGEPHDLRLEPDPQATPEQSARRAAWLRGSGE